MSLGGVLGIAPKIVEDTQRHALLAQGKNNQGRWVYGQAQGALDAYEAVKVDNDGQLIPLTTTVSGAEPTVVGFPQVAAADNDYLWVWIGEGGGSGVGVYGLVMTLCAAGAKLYTTATAGEIDDSATDLIQGLSIVTTNAGGTTAAAELFNMGVNLTNAQD